MTAPPSYGIPPARRLSKSSLLSLICGILACVPGVGLLAMLAGVIGFFRAGKPTVSGRWMAVVGAILGAIGSVFWVIALIFGLGVFGLVSAALEPPRAATHDFIKALADNDPAGIADTALMSDDDLAKAGEFVRAQGGFIDTDFPLKNVSINEGGTGHIEGTAQFRSGKLRVRADLTSGGPKGWRVTSIDFGG